MSSFKELTDKARKLLNPPWYKKFMKVDYYSVAELFDKASKITKEQKEKVDCLFQAGKYYDLAGCKFDSAESYFTLYKCTNEKEYLVKSCYQFYDINAFSIAATRMGEYVESVFQKKNPIVKENKLFLYDDLNFILKCYDQANMPISSRKYYYYKGYLLFIDNKTEDCKECFKLAYKKELVDFINGKKEDFLASDWMEEEIKSKSKILLDIL